jgi:hypothetical protein
MVLKALRNILNSRMNMRLLLPLLWLGFSGVLHANEVQPSHPMATMSDTELEAVTDHDQSKDDAGEKFTTCAR